MKKAILTVVMLVGIISIVYSQVLQTAKQKKQIERYLGRSIVSNIYHQTLYFVKSLARTVTIGQVVVDGTTYDMYQDLDTYNYYIVDHVILSRQ